ncbi:MAG TPA: 16S rRNA (cytosine(1402)-N(4))-methyltransferase RsmH [Candidatus Saccharimonadales bacterium]|nr:16S rRNA (cytosine(1402)-N(4))-methyltransferase RsmH [Candidatus Saccharimonadales bacterium]
MHQNQNKNKHTPVLLHEVLTFLSPKSGERYLDLTAGYGGHAREVLNMTGATNQAVLVDRDEHAIHELEQTFHDQSVRILHSDFLSAAQELHAAGEYFDLILADLGVSSPHLNEANRGFAINAAGPLDMRMDPRQELTAATIVNEYSTDDLADILERYGEEPKARQIARLIVQNRPFSTTTELAEVVSRAWQGRSRVHPATRTFQALRIAVNDELRLLEAALPLWLELLSPHGRIAIISFHSLEDRIVKQFFAEHGGNRYDAVIKELTKRPITPQTNEIVSNPRARSAKLRAAVKIKIEREAYNANSG